MQNISALFNLNGAKTRNGEQGFSLLELVVAMLIFMIVTGSIWGVLRVAQQSRSVVNQQVALAKNILGLKPL